MDAAGMLNDESSDDDRQHGDADPTDRHIGDSAAGAEMLNASDRL
jgi:hypothetical protein